ncbi:MAG TPA: acyl-CoA dehydrogenase family protein, partial [Acidimicrobiia bacterium]|nr:acyl-CoA dehydrogenase family protein [Acidimicrobiia bacterium]
RMSALMERVRQVEPVIVEHRAWQEENRRMAPEVFDALSAAGLWAIYKPVELGGLECNPGIALSIFEEISRIEPSVGWAVANQAGIDTFGTVLPEEGAKDAYADPGRPVAGAWFPPGQATPVEGGYQVTGRWQFASTCHYAQYLTGMTMIVDDGEPRIGPDGSPVMMVVFFPPEEAQIVDTWHTMGMRGTGSHDIGVRQIFVPDRRSWIVGPVSVERSGPYASPFYNAFPWLSFSCLGPVGLGIGQAAVDELIRLAGEKTPSYTARSLRDRETAQSNVARAQATIGAARAYLHQAVERIQRTAQAGRKPPLHEGIEVQLATCNALEAASKVVNLVHDTVGTSGIRQEHRFEQLYRDGRTISQHAFASLSRYESCGKVLFGLPSDWGFFYL